MKNQMVVFGFTLLQILVHSSGSPLVNIHPQVHPNNAIGVKGGVPLKIFNRIQQDEREIDSPEKPDYHDEPDFHEEPESCSRWSYPSNKWPATCRNSCGGIRQSPIDIASIAPYSGSGLLRYANYNQKISKVNIKNNGHSATVSWAKNFHPLRISGGGLGGDYTLAQFHFHWGCENNRGSEHTKDGRRYAMEMHLVHYKTAYGSFQEAIKYSDGVAVLAVFFNVGAENAAIKPITDNLYKITEPGKQVDITFKVALEDLLPSNKQTFYRYLGSLTTPTCNEVVVWTVLDSHAQLSQAQLDAFRSMKDHHHASLCDNYRELQPLNRRNIVVYNA